MSISPEILVHISAPSRASDDARYRRELQSYLDFQPAQRHALSSKKIGHEYQTEYGDALEQVADASFHSSSDPAPASHVSRPQIANSKVVTPASAVFNNARILLSKTPALVPGTVPHKPFFQSRAPASSQRRPRTAPDSFHGSTGIQETPLLRLTQSDSWKTPPSVIPDSQPTPFSQKRLRSLPQSSSPSPTRSSSPTVRKRQRLVSPPALPQLEIEDQEDEDEASSTPHPPTLPAPSSSAYAGDEEASSTPVAPVIPSPLQPTTSSPVAAPSSPASSVFAPSSLQIWAPRPQTSTEKFRTHITKKLAELTDRLPLSQVYIPQRVWQRRQLDISERGHWRISLSKFSESQKTKFWDFLKEHIGKGLAGFGVMCALEGPEDQDFGLSKLINGNESDDQVGENGDQSNGNSGKLVAKVYCWGEIVGEIWNVLFIAGHRQIKGIGVCWIDADDNVVIRMK